MYKKLVRYDQWHFAEVDPVCLKRLAIRLCNLIIQKIKETNDIYGFYKKLPDYVCTSGFPSMRLAGHGSVCVTATASRGTIAAKSCRRLNRYCTSAK